MKITPDLIAAFAIGVMAGAIPTMVIWDKFVRDARKMTERVFREWENTIELYERYKWAPKEKESLKN